MPNANGLDRNRFFSSIVTMSPPGLVPFCFALLVTMSSSSENISCSLSDRGEVECA